MGAQDNTEKVLRSLHVLLSKSEPYPKEPSKVIIDRSAGRTQYMYLSDYG